MRKVCFLMCVLILSIAVLGFNKSVSPEIVQEPTYTQRQWSPIYNDHTCGICAQWADSECASSVELTTEEILSILPGKQLDGATYTGLAFLRENGSVLRVLIWVTKEDQEASIVIGNDSYHYACCISREPDAVSCLCGDLEYKIYCKDDILFAETECNGDTVLVQVRAKVNAVDIEGTDLKTYEKEDIEQYKPLFEEILELLSWYETGKPDLSAFVPSGNK